MGNDSTRRRAGAGSVKEYRPGKWRARITSGVKADGSPRTLSKVFDSQGEAESWLRARSVELSSRPDVGAGITLAQLWELYCDMRLPELAKTTQVTYSQRMRPVVDAIGEQDVSTITHGQIQRMYDGMKPSIAKRTNTALSATLTWGVRNRLLETNPLYKAPFVYGKTSRYAEAEADVWDIDPFAAIEGARDVWSTAEVGECFRRIRGLPLESVWLCCVGAGLRVEEAFALRKMDVRRIVASYDEYGHEIWVTQLAVHHATTREEKRKSTKTAHSIDIVPMLEPFGERLWQIVDALPERQSPICSLSAARQNRHWRAYFAKPTDYHKRMADSRKVQGHLHGLPYIPLSRMRATHTSIVQDAGVLDSINALMHRNTSTVQRKHYMRPDMTKAAVQVSRLLDF